MCLFNKRTILKDLFLLEITEFELDATSIFYF